MMNSYEPLYLQLADLLRERIVNGVYPVGSPLPSEQALCNEHQQSRMTVRRALAVLRDEGLITKRRGAPSTIRPRAARKVLSLHGDQRLISRMPSRQERVLLSIDPGVPVLEVREIDGTKKLFAADEVEVVTTAQTR
ncbi:GntR family transcriptional regulator [Dactylosporangium vinaceum]|uniref:GntR family transcriptional regulator n=1 Tax=Dactylosporangium vinaceum TaxID=53362 RepID=A0ABV5LZ60_9ACTN|nr:GntR family transcriptional regulator [Dactylosporangium vinaceum]UAB95186.1 GntR family transcriptional regulator [Dactylosporangium vinaceum]